MKAFVLMGPLDKIWARCFFQEGRAAKLLFVEGRAGELSRFFPGRSNAQKRKSLLLLDDNVPLFWEIRWTDPRIGQFGPTLGRCCAQLKYVNAILDRLKNPKSLL